MGGALSSYENRSGMHTSPRRSDFCIIKIGAACPKIGAAWTKNRRGMHSKSSRHALKIGAACTKNRRGMHTKSARHALKIGAAWTKKSARLD